MTVSPDRVAEVAHGLSPAMREALLTTYDVGFGQTTTLASGRSARALNMRGLTLWAWAPSGLTPLGIAVRNHIAEGGVE